MRFLRRKFLARLLTPCKPMMGRRTLAWATARVNPWGTLYVPPQLGVDGFFRALHEAGTRHVVLRWFEDLPHVERGHDLDILVADDAIETVRALLSEWPRGQRIDFYSETGDAGTGYRPRLLNNVPAFPPKIAKEILASASVRPGGWGVPGPREHFLGLAFHAVYLKGLKSGLPPDENTPAQFVGSRDYSDVLTRLGADVGIEVEQPVTMASLDAMLSAQGWRPNKDHLASLVPANPWIDNVS